jgi:Ca-activated chloride channel homolog
MKLLPIILILFLIQTTVSGQNERKYVRQGNHYYLQGIRDTTKLDTLTFSKAETEYRKALDKKPDDLKWNFNLNNSMYKQAKFKDAITGFEQIAKQTADPKEKAKSLHNLGNARLFDNQLDESIESYKSALRNNPDDIETKYNLAYAQRMKKQQQQQQNKNQNKDQNKEQNKDQQKKNQDQNQDQNKQQPPPKISKQNAEQLLQALQNDEKNIQDKVKKAQAVQVKSSRVEKDW